jgi:hypothetical protein
MLMRLFGFCLLQYNPADYMKTSCLIVSELASVCWNFIVKNEIFSCLIHFRFSRSLLELGLQKSIGTILLALSFLVGFVFTANATPSSCTNTWFRHGVKSRLDIDWNTPLPVYSTDTIEIPDPGTESNSSPIVHLSETQITDSYFGIIEITIAGILPGQRVILEKYKVNDPVKGVETDSLLQGYYILQDGYSPSSGEVYNFNVPNDFSENEGEIMAQLDFYEPSPSSIVGHYVYRVRSPNHTYPPTDVPFQVHAEEWDQKFEGVITSNGQPVPHAFVVLLDPLGLDNDFVKGTIADENGRYELFADWEEFDLVALSPGFVSTYGRNVSYFLDAGETRVVNISLVPGDRTISGVLTDAHNPEVALPGVEVLLFSLSENNDIDTNLFTICWTDHEGKFSAEVTAGRWGVVPRLQAVYDRGYQSPGLQLAAVIDAREGSSEGHIVPLTKGESIIWGTLTSSEPDEDGEYNPLTGVEIRAIRSSDGAAAHAVTDGDGDYRLAVGPGYWNVFAVAYSLYNEGHTSPFPSDLKVPPGRVSLQYDFHARPTDAWVYGWVEDEYGDPVGKFELRAVNLFSDKGELPVQSTYETDGYFFFDLAYGDWVITPEPIEAARRQLIFKKLPELRVDPLPLGEEPILVEVEMTTVPSNGTLSMIFKSEDGDPIPNIRVHGMTTGADGTDYHSFGLSDASGVAKIAVFEGRWMFHPSDINLREQGFNEVYTFEIDLQSGDQEHIVIPDRRQGTYPELSVRPSPFLSSPQFVGEGESGQRFIIEASTQLGKWREFGRVITEQGNFVINEFTEPVSEQLFIRARPE